MPRDYRHIDKDPIIDLIRTVVQKRCGGTIPRGYLGRLSARSGVSEHAIRNWLYGETRRPQNLSSKFVLSALDVATRYFDRLSNEEIIGFGTAVGRNNVIEFQSSRLRNRRAA